MLSAGNNTNAVTFQNFAPQTGSLFYRIIPVSIITDKNLPPLASHLYSVIATAINIDTNSAKITHEELAQLSRLSRRSVIRYVEVLKKAGLITIESAPQGSKIPNIYHLAGSNAGITLRMRPHMTQSHTKTNHVSQMHSPDEEIGVTESHEAPSQANKSLEQMQIIHLNAANHVSDLHTLKQDSVQIIKESDSDVVVDNETAIFHLDGVEEETMLHWTKQYGVTRVKEVIDALPRQKNVQNVPGWVASALKHGWEFGKKQTQKPKQQYAENDGRRYISGEYGSMLQH